MLKNGNISLPPFTHIPLSRQMSLVVMERRQLPAVAVRLVIWGGSAEDAPGREGLRRLTAKLLKKGTGRYSAGAFSFAFESRGATISVHTTYDAVIISGTFLAKDTAWGLGMIAAMVLDPRFSSLEILRLKKKTAGEFKSIVDEPSQLCGIIHNANLFHDHPYGRPIIGYHDSVQKIGREHILDLYRKTLLKSRMLLTVVGDAATGAVERTASSLFGDLPAASASSRRVPAAPRVRGRTLYLVDKPDLTQAHIRIGAVGIARNNPAYYRLIVANTLFGGSFTSRLNNEIRVNRGLTYGIRSQVSANKFSGSTQIVTFTKTGSAAQAVELILREMNALTAEKIPGEELSRTKRYMTGLFPLSLETNRKVAQHLSDIYFYGISPRYIDTFCENIDRVTADDIRQTAREYFSDKDAVATVLGNIREIPRKIEEFGTVVYQKFTDVYSADHHG